MDRSEVRRELWVAAALFVAVAIVDAAFIFVAAHAIPDLAASYVIVP